MAHMSLCTVGTPLVISHPLIVTPGMQLAGEIRCHKQFASLIPHCSHLKIEEQGGMMGVD